MTDTPKSLIAEAAVAIGKLEKDGRNSQGGGYEYISERAVKGAVRKHVYGRGLAPDELKIDIISDEWHPYGRDGNMANYIKVRCTIEIDDCGRRRHGEGLGAGVDYADKALMKAQTAAVREAWKNMLGISDGNDPEGDAVGDEGPADKPNESKPQKQTPVRASGSSLRDVEVTFGKHKGKTLGKIPEDYLSWLAENANDADMKAAAAAVHKMRTANIDPTPDKGPEYPEDDSKSYLDGDDPGPDDEQEDIPF